MANEFSDPIITNSLFMGNGSSICVSGGGIDNTDSSPVLTNCSFSGNRATSAGSIFISNGPSTVVRNIISWGNSSELDGDLANATINYSIIQGGWTGTGTGNLSLDPKFVSQPAVGQSTGDLKLTASSPAINGGAPSTTSATVGTTDLASNPRFYSNGQIDMGAYEYQGISTIPDLTLTTYARPSTLYGTNNITVVVDVVELVGTPTSSTVVVRLTKDARVKLNFEPTATIINNRSVQNSVWNFDGTSNASYYILTTTAAVPPGDKLSFGFTGVLTPGATTGTITLSSVIVGGSGQEIRVTNNSDADRLDYFQQ